MAELLAATLFVFGYAAISMEHRLFVNKAATSMLLAVLLWALASIVLPVAELQTYVMETGADMFGLIIFLMTSMTLVEILVHYHTFDIIEHWLREKRFSLYKLGWALSGITFLLSSFIANLTVTIIVLQIGKRLFPQQYHFIVAVIAIVIANAGGSFSPIGDVTTLMLWFADSFNAKEVVLQGFLPCLALMLVTTAFLLHRVNRKEITQAPDHDCFRPSHTDQVIILATIGTFLLPLLAAALDLPPYMGLLGGLGVVWIMIDIARRARPQETHLQAKINKFMQQTDIESIQFFLGILLSVAALHAMGVLDIFTNALLGISPDITRVAGAFISLGLASGIVDNLPLVAAAISSVENVPASLWVLLSIAAGTGGSLMVIGSASGVIAMGMMPSLTFGRYLKVGTIPALIGFAAAVAIWIGQYWLFLA